MARAPDTRSTFVFVYGPPAAGKLTIATGVAERTSLKLLHNHLIIDAITPLFPFGTDGFHDLVGRFRAALYETAAREGMDVILTFGYTPEDKAAVEGYVDAIRAHGGQVLFVQLMARPETLINRVASPDRHEHGKLVDPGTLEQVLELWDFSQCVPFEPNLEIDTDALTAAEAIEHVIEHYGLDSV